MLFELYIIWLLTSIFFYGIAHAFEYFLEFNFFYRINQNSSRLVIDVAFLIILLCFLMEQHKAHQFSVSPQFLDFCYEYDLLPMLKNIENYKLYLTLKDSFFIIDTIDFLSFSISQFNFSFVYGIDGISLTFIFLTSYISLIVVYVVNRYQVKNLFSYNALFYILQLLLLLSFTALNLFYFFIFFESVLIPMFLIIGLWGSRSRKIKAAYYFFLYTMFGSIFMLTGLILLYLKVGTFNYITLLHMKLDPTVELFIWLSFFIAFAVKIPMFPFHIWLPEAHVEAPTGGSVILAALLLKLGGYGFFRFSIALFPYATSYFLPLVYTLSILGIIYASLTTLRQIDLKKIIAYSSIAHMSMVVLGLFSLTIEGIEGALLMMIGHGFISSGLFLLVGALYERYHTRLIKYYGGLTQVMPLFSIIFLFFSLSNLSFPGTANFVGEFLILLGLGSKSLAILFLSGFGILLSAVYSIWLYNRVAFGELKVQYFRYYYDLNVKEINVFISLIFFILLMGIYPDFFLFRFHDVVIYLINDRY